MNVFRFCSLSPRVSSFVHLASSLLCSWFPPNVPWFLFACFICMWLGGLARSAGTGSFCGWAGLFPWEGWPWTLGMRPGLTWEAQVGRGRAQTTLHHPPGLLIPWGQLSTMCFPLLSLQEDFAQDNDEHNPNQTTLTVHWGPTLSTVFSSRFLSIYLT